jgi:hypothetical protein
MLGESMNTARATSTISITYSTMVWPSSSFVSFLNRSLSKESTVISLNALSRASYFLFQKLPGQGQGTSPSGHRLR